MERLGDVDRVVNRVVVTGVAVAAAAGANRDDLAVDVQPVSAEQLLERAILVGRDENYGAGDGTAQRLGVAEVGVGGPAAEMHHMTSQMMSRRAVAVAPRGGGLAYRWPHQA